MRWRGRRVVDGDGPRAALLRGAALLGDPNPNPSPSPNTNPRPNPNPNPNPDPYPNPLPNPNPNPNPDPNPNPNQDDELEELEALLGAEDTAPLAASLQAQLAASKKMDTGQRELLGFMLALSPADGPPCAAAARPTVQRVLAKSYFQAGETTAQSKEFEVLVIQPKPLPSP